MSRVQDGHDSRNFYYCQYNTYEFQSQSSLTHSLPRAKPGQSNPEWAVSVAAMPREGARRRSRPSPQLQPQPAPMETDPDIADEEQKNLEAAIAASLSDAMSTNFASQLASMEDFDDGFPTSFLCPITSELMRCADATDSIAY